VDSTRRIVEGSVECNIEDVKSEFEVPILESGEMVIGGRPALKIPCLTHGRTVYFRFGISVINRSAQTKRKNNNSVGLCGAGTIFR
jgi:hypothetical protein